MIFIDSPLKKTLDGSDFPNDQQWMTNMQFWGNIE